jgi:hypothetical protein
LPKTPHGQCEARLRSGEQCTSVAPQNPEGLNLCAGCRKRAAKELASRKAAQAAAVAEAEGLVEEAAAAEPAVEAEHIASLRQALRSGLMTTEVAEHARELLLQALAASRDVYSTCPHCSRRHAVHLPDLATRVGAVRELLNQLEGAMVQNVKGADEREKEIAAKAQADLDSLTDSELALLAYSEDEERDLKEEVLELARRVLAEAVA